MLLGMPPEVFQKVLPYCDTLDVKALESTCRQARIYCNWPQFWQTRLREDFGFDTLRFPNENGATSKEMYNQLWCSRSWVWGDSNEGRLGFTDPHAEDGILPFPRSINPPCKFKQLEAGGWSLQGLDFHEQIWVTGQQADWPVCNHDEARGYFEDPKCRTDGFVQLRFPESMLVRFKELKCSRGFSFALDTQSHIWIFQSWGRPYKFCSPLLQNPNDPVVQIAGGWDNGACLTQSGKVFVFWPKSGFHHERCKKKDDELDFVNPHPNNLGILNEQERYIQCYPWGMRGVDPLQLPDLPYADLLPIRPGAPEHFECKLVKIALGGHFIVGLTDGGHVLALDLPNATSYFHPTSCATSWKYLVFFSSRGDDPTFEIAGIAAQHETLMAFSNSGERPIVYLTQSLLSPLNHETPQKTIIVPQDGGQIRSLHAADYHCGALTTDGRLYTFGSWLRGGLGLGDPLHIPPGSPGGYETEQLRKQQFREYGISPPPVWQPTEVVFGDPRGGRKGRRTFVHQVAFGGWHSACSAVDLEPDHIEGEIPQPPGEDRAPGSGQDIPENPVSRILRPAWNIFQMIGGAGAL